MINLPERIKSLGAFLSRFKKTVFTELRVAMPAIVVDFDVNKQTVSCRLAVRELLTQEGQLKFVDFPVLKEVPVVMPRGGGYAMTFPIKAGDECMVIFQDMCMDSWWFRGGIQNRSDLRRHDLSDAIAIFSPWSQPNVIPSYNNEGVELRSLDGSKTIVIDDEKIEATNGQTKISVTPQDLHLQTPTSSLKMNSEGLTVTDLLAINLNAPTVNINGGPYKLHTHTGVQSGGGTTGPVNL